MNSDQVISRKITLLGSHSVGKTSLITRFVEGKFPEDYVTTIGLKVDKKTVKVGTYQLDLLVWDIAGQDDPARFPNYYLNGCHGFIYVVDLGRPETYQSLKKNLKMIEGLLPGVPYLLVANKKDLLRADQLPKVLSKFQVQPDGVTSAKEDEQVDDVFLALGKKMINQYESTGA